MKFLSSPRFLAVYSGVVTITFAAVVLGGAAMVRNQTLGVITARRINIDEKAILSMKQIYERILSARSQADEQEPA